MTVANVMELPALGERSTVVDSLLGDRRSGGRFFFLRDPDSPRTMSPEDFRTAAFARAGALWQAGVRQGSHIGLLIQDQEEFVRTFAGAMLLGAIPVPIDSRMTMRGDGALAAAAAHVCRAAATSLLVSDAGEAVSVEAHRSAIPCLERVAMIAELASHDEAITDAHLAKVRPEDTCFLQFTSGSVSAPKGIRVSHANLVANARGSYGPHGFDLRADDRAVSWLPFYHDMGLIGFFLGAILSGMRVMYLSTASFSRRPDSWLRSVDRHRATITFAPNFAYDLMARLGERGVVKNLDLSCLRVAGCGAEPVQARTMKRFAQAFASAGFRREALLPCYGLAEATLAVSLHAHRDPVRIDRVDFAAFTRGEAIPTETPDALEIVSCGAPLAEHEARIVDGDGNVLPERSIGEICVRGASVTSGYFVPGLSEASAANTDAWLKTGDLGYLADGEIYVCGRERDLIIVRGNNFYPTDLEAEASQIAVVRPAGVVAFGVKHDGSEEVVMAVEALRVNAESVCEQIRARIVARFGLTLRDVLVVPFGAISRTSSGKVQRGRMRALYLAGELTSSEAARPKPHSLQGEI